MKYKKRDSKQLLQLSTVSGNTYLELFWALPLFPIGVTQFGHNADNNVMLLS